MSEPVIGLFWKRDMMIIIAMICGLMFATMAMVICGPMLAIDKQLSEMNSYAPKRIKEIELRVAALENAEKKGKKK